MVKICFILISSLLSLSVYGQSKKQLDSLSTVLEEIYKNDQQPRYRMDTLQKKYGASSPEVAAQWKYLIEKDSINTQVVASVIDTYGWLGPGQISKDASASLFYVIQHSDINTQTKYLPVLGKAISQGKEKPDSYAYLSDRIKMKTGRYQTYGTQISGDYRGNLQFWPIEDELNVNKRRQSVGLDSIQKYASNFNISYKEPQIDSLKGNIIISGYVGGNDNYGIASAKIYTSNNKLIAQTNSDGSFRVIVPRTLVYFPLIVKKEGFNSRTITGEINRDVFNFFDLILTKE